MSLGFSLYNAFNGDQENIEKALFGLSGRNQILPNYNCQKHKKSVAIIAGTMPAFSEQIGTLLELYKIPQITYGPFHPNLNDKDQFPTLYQMTTKDSILVHGIIRLLLHFGWTWVEVFISDDIKGEQFLWELKSEMVKYGICVGFTAKFPAAGTKPMKNHLVFMSKMGVSSANVFIMCADAETFVILDMVQKLYLTRGKMWIITTKWYVDLYEMVNVLQPLHGSLSFSRQKREIPGFKHFLKTLDSSRYMEYYYFRQFWRESLDCISGEMKCKELEDCPQNSSLELKRGNIDMMTVFDSSYLIYNAVYAVAQALHKMLLAKTEKGLIIHADQSVLLPWQLHPFLRNIQFTNKIGDHISLGDKRNSAGQYDILNTMKSPLRRGLLVKVGEFVFSSSHDQGLTISDEMIEWPIGMEEVPQSVCSQSCGPGFKKILQEGKPICCFDCISCAKREISNQTDAEQCIQCPVQEYPNNERDHCLPKSVTFLAFEDSLGMALACMALCLSVITAVVLGVFVKHRDTPIVKANNRGLSYILLISLLLCFLCSLLFMGRPSTATCILQQVTFGIVFTVAVSTVLAKTITVILAFKATKPGRRMRWLLVSGASNSVIPICSLIQVIICGIWLGTSPPFVDIDAHSEPRNLIIICNKGSATAFYCVLGYLGSLALGSFTVAFLARNLPDTFNEAKFLTFSMLVFCSVWVTFLPVYHSTKGKVMVAVEVFSILASTVFVIYFVFGTFPKCKN
ncbi:PREDICTED: vomeronasal type-2 receptor 116-like [Galeopterus variegatus]|uniref:Vomeronasal type-2 receptor 116-like n=1 Tax=Galeopterus variegatus TaxID=482537 RepID=A0ABM0RVK3_GALVR|nr:PREDICTED: vomeronasal type-2 receptor 116-like [Galeopterus variegatus]